MEVKYYYANNTKVINTIRKTIYEGKSIGDGEYSSAKVGHNGIEDITVEFAYSNDITNFDIDVADAIYTIYKEKTYKYPKRKSLPKYLPRTIKDVTFSTREVLCTLSGDNMQTLTPTLRSEIEASIERLRETKLTLDCSKQIKEFKKGDLTGFEDRPFLELEEDSRTGIYCAKVVDEEDINEVSQHYFMPLYYYAERLRQIISYKQEYLYTTGSIKNNKSSLRDNEDNIQLKRYLIRRIQTLRNYLSRSHTTMEDIKNSKKGPGKTWPGNVIHFSDIFGMLSIREENYKSRDAFKKKLNRVLRDEKSILDYYITIKYITDYEYDEDTWDMTINAEPAEKKEKDS